MSFGGGVGWILRECFLALRIESVYTKSGQSILGSASAAEVFSKWKKENNDKIGREPPVEMTGQTTRHVGALWAIVSRGRKPW